MQRTKCGCVELSVSMSWLSCALNWPPSVIFEAPPLPPALPPFAEAAAGSSGGNMPAQHIQEEAEVQQGGDERGVRWINGKRKQGSWVGEMMMRWEEEYCNDGQVHGK